MPKHSPEEVLEQLQPIFQDVLNQPNLVITRQSNALNTKNWDSLAHIDLLGMIEARYKIRFALGEQQDLKEVGDLVDLVVKKTDK